MARSLPQRLCNNTTGDMTAASDEASSLDECSNRRTTMAAAAPSLHGFPPPRLAAVPTDLQRRPARQPHTE
jgi:hypothetical protein